MANNTSKNENTSVIDRISRQWQLLRLVPSPPNQPITTRDLARQLAHTFAGARTDGEPTPAFIRKIQHDVEKLSAVVADLKIDTDNGTHRISWRTNAPRLTLRGMSIDEQIAFGVLEKTGIDLLPQTSRKALKPYFDEARRCNSRWTRKIVVVPDGIAFESPKIKPQVEATVYGALHHDTSIRVTY